MIKTHTAARLHSQNCRIDLLQFIYKYSQGHQRMVVLQMPTRTVKTKTH